MKTLNQTNDLKRERSEIISTLENLPDYQKITVESRLMLLMDFEKFVTTEFIRHGSKFRKVEAIKNFCDVKGINWKTFYDRLRSYNQNGVMALVPQWGHRKGKGQYNDSILPILRGLTKTGNNYTAIYKDLEQICKAKGIKAPHYATVIRLIIENELDHHVKEKKIAKSKSKKPSIPEQSKRVNGDDSSHNSFKLEMPEWIRITDTKAFNIAFYKYALTQPFLNPDLKRKERTALIKKIVAQTHNPSPGVHLKFAESTFRGHITAVKKGGFDAVIPKHCFRKVHKSDNKITVKLNIDTKNPLASLDHLREAIEKYCPPSHKREISINYLDRCLSYTNRFVPKYKPVSLGRTFSTEDMRKLKAYSTGVHAGKRQKALAILMANENRTMLEISTAISRPYKTIDAWFRRFKEVGIDFIETKRDKKKHDEEHRERTNRIIRILHQSPKDYDINRSAWILKDLSKAYERDYGKALSTRAISRAIKETNYSWKRARKVLTSPDPKYREKTKKVLETLQNLGPNDTFFFIDEAGPWQVKKYGGKSLTPKGVTKTYPQFQKSKGRVTYIAALDALKNQTLWFFTKSKDTSAVICLIRILFHRYHKYSKLYLTWDCASWHKSKGVMSCIETLNGLEDGPTIEVVPLPKQAQFLNVIESVNSGVKRAVVFNSDYESEYEMKMAISRHFAERNEYFKANPKRAGNKIWDIENFNFEDFESGLHKRM